MQETWSQAKGWLWFLNYYLYRGERTGGKGQNTERGNIGRRYVGAHTILCRKVEVIYQGNDRNVTSAWIPVAVCPWRFQQSEQYFLMPWGIRKEISRSWWGLVMPSTSADEGKKALWSHPVCPFPQFPLNTFDTPGLILWFAELYLRNNKKKKLWWFQSLAYS